MKRMLIYALCAGLVVAFMGTGFAKTNDPAKPLSVAKWVKNGPVTLADGKGKNVYLVEFWATWCPPCRESIPHLTELQKKYKDKGLVAVGVSNEELDVVQIFVEKQGDNMNYAVAVDKNDETAKNYMEAYNINTIPHAFLVDRDGMIVWHGNPLDKAMEAQLQKVLDAKPTAKDKDKAPDKAKEKDKTPKAIKS